MKPSGSEAVRFSEVSFRREGRPILKAVDWTVRTGERWVLLGRNGSGKSTLLSMIPALTYPTSGTLEVFGKTFGMVPWEQIRKRTAFVSATLNKFLSTLYGMTVSDIVLSGKFLTIGLYEDADPDDLESCRRMLHDFHLTELAGKRFATLSEGEKRRVLTARALMNPAELLVLDEPCASLDICERESLLSGLERRVQNTGRTVLYVTHNLEEIMPFITHAAVLGEGRMLAAGPKKEVLTDAMLSHLYGQNVQLEWDYERPWIKIVP